MRVAAILALVAATAAPAADFEIKVENRAGLPQAQVDSILADFRLWAGRVYEFHHVEDPAPVTLRLSRGVPFGFYRNGTVVLPPNDDRWTMLDDWVHELTHHATGHASSFFFKEGAAVHTLEALFATEGRVPRMWPQFGQPSDAWVAVYVRSGTLLPLAEALDWSHYRGKTPAEDFRSWQIYNQAGSFVGWYLREFGYDAFRKAFDARRPAGDIQGLEQKWLAAVKAADPPAFDVEKALGSKPRYRNYAERLKK